MNSLDARTFGSLRLFRGTKLRVSKALKVTGYTAQWQNLNSILDLGLLQQVLASDHEIQLTEPSAKSTVIPRDW